jgi:hypothetical protein
VVRLFVFGSALRDDFRAGESDIDLLVEFELPDSGDDNSLQRPVAVSAERHCPRDGPSWVGGDTDEDLGGVRLELRTD